MRLNFIIQIMLAIVGIVWLIAPPIAMVLGFWGGTLGLPQKAVMIAGLFLLIESFILRLKNPVIKYFVSGSFSIGLFIIWYQQLYPASNYSLNLFQSATFGYRLLILAHLAVIFFSVALAALTAYMMRIVLTKSEYGKKNFIFIHITIILSVVLLGVGLEAISTAVVPSWPARVLRPVITTGDDYNSWGMRDSERTIQKSPDVKRVIFLGDSILEGGFCRNTLSGYTQDVLTEFEHNIECVNLGVSATGPRQYLYRWRNFGTTLNTDALLLFIYIGNDLINTLYPQPIKLVDELPLPSILGTLTPRFDWFLVNRLGLSEYGLNNKPITNEFEDLQRMSQMPYEEGVTALSEHMHHYYFPNLPNKQIEEILRKGGPSFWQELAPRQIDQEYLQGWKVRQIIQLTLRVQQKGDAVAGPNYEAVNATARWIDEINENAKSYNIPMIIFLVPVAENVDPEYKEFWSPWYQAENLERLHGWRQNREALFMVLKQNGLTAIDLTDILNGIPGTYRKFDGHWTEKGHELVAAYISQCIIELFDMN